jgi:hypothetical protein
VAITPVDLSTAVGGQTSATAGVTTDGAFITGPPSCAAIYVRQSAAGTFAGNEGDDVPLDADVWTLAYQRSDGISSRPVVLVKPSTGTASVYARVV